MTARQPAPEETPVNLDAEEYVLSAMMMSAAAIDRVQPELDPGDFFRPSHAKIYRAALSLHQLGEPVDGITVAARLHELGQLGEVGGPERIHELVGHAPATANVLHHARIIVREARRRHADHVADEIKRHVLEGHDPDEIEQRIRELADELTATSRGDALNVETWHQFESQAHDRIPQLVEGLWPEAAFGFIGAGPKQGKTWIGLALSIAVATGRPFLGHFTVTHAVPVIYVALEGHRAAIRARIGAIARGMGINPDGNDLKNLHLLYKPRGLNLADPAWAQALRHAAARYKAALITIDVLRAGARIKENDQAEFSNLRSTLQPITDDGRSLAVLHHFVKLTETSKERVPGERLSGSGAMFGALDVAIYITGSQDGARKLRLEFDARDLATPDTLHVQLEGEGSGENSGYTYRDTAAFHVLTDREIDEDDLKAPAQEIYEWINEHGGEATTAEVCFAFESSDKTIRAREHRLEQLGVAIIRKRGKPTSYRILTDDDLASSEPRNSDAFRGQMALTQEQPDTSERRNSDPLPGSGNRNNLPEPTNPKQPSGSEVGSTEPTSEVPTSELKADNHAPLRDTPEPRNSNPTSGDMQGKSTSEPRNPLKGVVPAVGRSTPTPDDLDELFGGKPAGPADSATDEKKGAS